MPSPGAVCTSKMTSQSANRVESQGDPALVGKGYLDRRCRAHRERQGPCYFRVGPLLGTGLDHVPDLGNIAKGIQHVPSNGEQYTDQDHSRK